MGGFGVVTIAGVTGDREVVAAQAPDFGEYRLLERIGIGGMGEVFLARREKPGFEKTAVIKRIRPEIADAATIALLNREASTAAQLTHPNLVQVFDFGHVRGEYFIAMEWVEGCDLWRIIRHGNNRGLPLRQAEVAAIGQGVCRGMAFAHSKGVIHRDICTHNVMVSRTGEPKVMDFGIATSAKSMPTDSTKGRICYMSPEQARGQPADERSDQFAVGAVLWECLTGERLFSGNSDAAIIYRIANCDVPRPSEFQSDIAPELENIVMRSLADEPGERFLDLYRMAYELERFQFSLGVVGIVRLAERVDSVLSLQKPPTQPKMPTQDAFLRYRSYTRESFLETYPYPFVLICPISEEAVSGLIPFETELVSEEKMCARVSENKKIVGELRKEPNLQITQVTVGRARNMDIVLRSPQISKMHAFFKQTVDYKYVVGDAGSTNGTRHNGTKIEKMSTVELHDGDVINFGDEFEGIYYEPASFFSLVNLERTVTKSGPE